MDNRRFPKIRSALRKTKRFSRGVLEGIISPFAIATYQRNRENSIVEQSRYAAVGFAVGSLANLFGHGFAAAQEDIRVFIPIMATNALSIGYELGRKYLNKKE